MTYHFMHLSKTNLVVSGKKVGFFAQGKLQLIIKKCLHFKLLVLTGSVLGIRRQQSIEEIYI